MIVAIIITVVAIALMVLANIFLFKGSKEAKQKREDAFLNLFDETKDKSKAKIGSCDNCGAVIEFFGKDAKCPYCGAQNHKK